MTKILMVCLGNICRSPLAEGILKSKLPDTFTVDSAGTSNYHINKSPDIRSIAVAKKHDIDISHLKGRQFKVSDFETFDFIYVMDESNYNNVIKLARHDQDIKKVNYILNVTHPDQNQEVPDPYYGEHDGFLTVYNMLDTACTLLAKKLNS